MAITWEPYFLMLALIDFTLCAFVFLITWRIARRFGWRGLAALLVVLAFFGPVRDHWYMRRFPEWGSYGSGFALVLARCETFDNQQGKDVKAKQHWCPLKQDHPRVPPVRINSFWAVPDCDNSIPW